MTVQIGSQCKDAIPDSGAAISVITRAKAQELGLTVTNNPDMNLTAYGNLFEVIEVVKDVPLQIQSAKIPIDLQVVDVNEGSILLGMDWFNKYRVRLNISRKELEFKSQGQKFKTLVDFTSTKRLGVFCMERF